MKISLCNLLGPICATYRFEDGSIMRRSSRESLTYERFQKPIHIEFCYNGLNGYRYYLPDSLAADERQDLIPKIEEYCRRKRYRIVKGQ